MTPQINVAHTRMDTDDVASMIIIITTAVAKETLYAATDNLLIGSKLHPQLHVLQRKRTAKSTKSTNWPGSTPAVRHW
jgi:hypothetical protein